MRPQTLLWLLYTIDKLIKMDRQDKQIMKKKKKRDFSFLLSLVLYVRCCECTLPVDALSI